MRLKLRFSALLAVLLAVPAFAQKVVVLEIDGDSTHRLRTQIENALRSAATVDVVALQAFNAAASRRKLKGAAAYTPAGVARTAKSLHFDAAVSGEVDGNTYKVLIWDRTGKELWTKELPLKRGLLSEDFAGKLSKAITAAAEIGAAKPDPSASADDEGGLDLSGDGEAAPPPSRRKPPVEDPNRDADLDTQISKKDTGISGPPLLRGTLGVVGTWRYQCLRPGSTSCRAYDIASVKPQGISIDFSAPSPYWGFGVGFEIYPLHAFTREPAQRFFNGLGILANLNFGISQINLKEETPQGSGPTTKISSTDVSYSIQLVYRVHFAMGVGSQSGSCGSGCVGYVGVGLGTQARSFSIDSTTTSLPSSQRVAPTGFGFLSVRLFDVSLPIVAPFRIEGGLRLFVSPKPSDTQITGYGSLKDPTGGVVSSGFGFEVGVAGEIWGPLGYVARFNYMSFNDQFKGQGDKWTVCDDTQCGGVSEEIYSQFLIGLTAKY
jgi:hypothetical protein